MSAVKCLFAFAILYHRVIRLIIDIYDPFSRYTSKIFYHNFIDIKKILAIKDQIHKLNVDNKSNAEFKTKINHRHKIHIDN